MDTQRHKTYKKSNSDAELDDQFKLLLEAGAREAYLRPWHRIERGLRLNRLRIFVEDITPQYEITPIEKEEIFVFLQKALDKKLLNTLKVVLYDQSTQRITMIKGLEIKRNEEGILKCGFGVKKPRTDTTRKKKKSEENFSVSIIPPISL